LGLNSHDVSKLLSLSQRNIENHRYRIRKRLGLKTEYDIAKFLQGF
jgi:DNA-binding CsgD family transcriptional regulator